MFLSLFQKEQVIRFRRKKMHSKIKKATPPISQYRTVSAKATFYFWWNEPYIAVDQVCPGFAFVPPLSIVASSTVRDCLARSDPLLLLLFNNHRRYINVGIWVATLRVLVLCVSALRKPRKNTAFWQNLGLTQIAVLREQVISSVGQDACVIGDRCWKRQTYTAHPTMFYWPSRHLTFLVQCFVYFVTFFDASKCWIVRIWNVFCITIITTLICTTWNMERRWKREAVSCSESLGNSLCTETFAWR